MSQTWLRAPTSYQGIITAPSGNKYSVTPGETLAVDNGDVTFLVAFGFTQGFVPVAPPPPIVPVMPIELVASLRGVDMNTTGDQVMTLSEAAAGKFFAVYNVLFCNASITLDTAQAGVFSGAGATGQSFFDAHALSGAAAPNGVLSSFFFGGVSNRSLEVGGLTTAIDTAPFVNVSVAQGAPATIDCYVFGYVLP